MATIVSMSATRVIFGEFDSTKRYLRSGVSGADIPITKGVTFHLAVGTGQATHWRYNVNGYVMDFGGSISSSASYTLVKI